jgi:hypothetical protein
MRENAITSTHSRAASVASSRLISSTVAEEKLEKSSFRILFRIVFFAKHSGVFKVQESTHKNIDALMAALRLPLTFS